MDPPLLHESVIGSFLLLSSSSSLFYDMSQLIHSPVDGHLGCFQFVAIVSEVTVNICIQIFVWTFFHFTW
jgi:hypothetical protein